MTTFLQENFLIRKFVGWHLLQLVLIFFSKVDRMNRACVIVFEFEVEFTPFTTRVSQSLYR